MDRDTESREEIMVAPKAKTTRYANTHNVRSCRCVICQSWRRSQALPMQCTTADCRWTGTVGQIKDWRGDIAGNLSVGLCPQCGGVCLETGD